MRTVKGTAGSPILEAIKEHGTAFTIAAVGLVLIFGITLVQDPSKWWIGLLGAVGFAGFILIAANGFVVLKALGSVFVLLLSIAGATAVGSMVSTVPLFALTWPVYQLSAYLLGLALSYAFYSGRGRWTYLGFMAIGQFALTALLLVINTEPHLSAIVGALGSLGGFAAAYLLNGRTRVSKKMPPSSFDRNFLEAVARGAEKLDLQLRIVPPRRGVDSHLLVYGDERAILLYPIELEQGFGVVGRRGTRLGYRGKDINPWLLKLAYSTSPSWKARGASPALVLVDTKRKNGGEGRLIGVSLPDSKRKAVVAVQPAPASRQDRDSYGEKLLLSSLALVKDYALELTEKQKLALSKVGLAQSDLAEYSEEIETGDSSLDSTTEADGLNSTGEAEQESAAEPTVLFADGSSTTSSEASSAKG